MRRSVESDPLSTVPPAEVPAGADTNLPRAYAALLNLRGIAAALVLSLGTTAFVMLLHEWYPSRAFTFLYLPMVAVLAFMGGRGPALVGTLASVGGAWYVLFGPGRGTPFDVGLAVFMVLFTASVVGLGEAMVRLPRPSVAAQALAAIVRSSDDAIFAKTLDRKILTWNTGAERMYGYTAAEAVGRPVSMLAPPDLPDDVPWIMSQLVRGRSVDRYETVRMKKDGTRFDVSLTVSPIRDDLGRLAGASTIARDISDRKRAERAQRLLIEAGDLFASSLSVQSLLQALAALIVPGLADWCTIDLVDDAGNLNNVTVVHRDPDKVALAKQLQEQTAADPRAQEGRRRVLKSGQAELHPDIPAAVLSGSVTEPAVLETLRGLGLRSSMTIPLTARGRVLGAIGLISAESGRRYDPDDLAFAEQLAHRAAMAVDNARLHEAETAARRKAEQLAGRMSRLQAFTAALSEALTPERVGHVALQQVVDELGAGAAALCLADDDTGKLSLVATRGYSADLNARWWREPERILPLTEAMQRQHVVWFPSWTVFRTRFAEAEPPGDPVRAGARAAVPLMLHGRAIGGLYMNFVEERQFGADELDFMLTIGRQCAQAVERARLYAREHQVATTLQRALLPADVPQIPGHYVDAAYVAATRASDVGGDWYDVFRLPDGHLCVAIGDVVGHGLQAAVIMGQVRQAIRTAALEGHEPAKVLALANHVLALNRQEGMTTAIVGTYDPLSLTFTYAAAGHPAPILADGNEVVTLTSGGLPLGFSGGGALPTRSVQLSPGALLVLYTDGLIEFRRDAAAGHAALIEAIRQQQTSPETEPAHRILDHILSGAQPRDDVAILTLAVAAGPMDRLDVVLPAEPSSLRLVRYALAQLSAGVGLDERRAFDLNVAVGEAVNNVVEHAYGASSGTIRLRASREDSTLRVEIEDAGRWRPDRPNNPGGRGFNLMRALTDRVQVATGESGTVVRLTLRFDPVVPDARPPAGVPGAEPPGGQPGPSSATAPGAAGDQITRQLPWRETIGAAQFDVHLEQGTPVVTATGELDLTNVGRFTEILERVAGTERDLVIVALGNVSYFDSHGVRALLRAHEHLAASRRRLALVAPAGSTVRRLIETAGLAAALPIFATVDAAVAGRFP
ncbi:MAG TPA: anti-sigma factor antagonist [bacterium]|nr:anti-sigma factor antagonist [bacterium]